jgi:hypothetical protein
MRISSNCRCTNPCTGNGASADVCEVIDCDKDNSVEILSDGNAGGDDEVGEPVGSAVGDEDVTGNSSSSVRALDNCTGLVGGDWEIGVEGTDSIDDNPDVSESESSVGDSTSRKSEVSIVNVGWVESIGEVGGVIGVCILRE